MLKENVPEVIALELNGLRPISAQKLSLRGRMDSIQDMEQPILETLVQQPIRLINHKKPQMLQCEIWSRLDMINQTTWGCDQDIHSGMASQDAWGIGVGMRFADKDGLFVGKGVLTS